MKVDFSGRTAVVTGAASGLGRCVAELLADSGARVIGFDVSPVDAAGIDGRRVDIGDPDSIDDAIRNLDGPVDVLCNIAGLPQTKPALDVLRVNFLGLRHLTESLAPLMAAGGSVTSVSSNAGNGWPTRQPPLEAVLATGDFASGLEQLEGVVGDAGDSYIFSKELVQLYTLRRSHTLFRERGVRMNSVSPGEMETPMMAEFRKATSDKVIDAVAQSAALGRAASPEEVAPSVVFLASDLAGFCCGAIFDVDGGYTAAQLTDQIDFSRFA
ncbi:MAG TPA: coniferyl-alcohol dehydrogenase [Acidimicrobiia bacterium]